MINEVMAGPGWKDTLLIWTYDEHGGYYDHVPPPEAPAPDGIQGLNPMQRFWWLRLLLPLTPLRSKIKAIDTIDSGTSDYTRLGFRVPAVIVSPFARKDYVSEVVYDHTSILRLIERKWNLPSLTWRDSAANDPLDCVDFDSPPPFLIPPQLPPSAIELNV